MYSPPPRPTRTDTPFPYTTPCRAGPRRLARRRTRCASRKSRGRASIGRVARLSGAPLTEFQKMASPHRSAALQAARAATDLIRKAFRGNFQVDYKADASPVTEVDIAAEHAIKSVLADRKSTRLNSSH